MRRTVSALFIACLGFLGLSFPGSTSAAIPEPTCFWFGPMGMQYEESNAAYPEESARYWGARFRLPEGSTLLLKGRYPHARFFSLNAYLDKGATDSINDYQIRPNRGSRNPYRPGAKRYFKKRAYTIRVSESGGGKNGLSLPSQDDKVQELIWRVYLPDRPGDISARYLPRPVLLLPSGQRLYGSAACQEINDAQRVFSLQTMPSFYYSALVNTPGADPATNPARSPLRWEKYFNLPLALSVFKYDTPSEDSRLADKALGEVGSNYDNLAVRYMTSSINASLGPVVLLRGKLPYTPRSGRNIKRMGKGQMRYWSICSNTSPVETKGIDCVYDRQVSVNRARRYKIVVSSPANRPDNAVRRCGYTWLNWGQEQDVLGRDSATLIMRNLSPASTFRRAVQDISIEDLAVTTTEVDRQKEVMGDYFPSGTYFSSVDSFESRGCS